MTGACDQILTVAQMRAATSNWNISTSRSNIPACRSQPISSGVATL